MGTLRAIWVRPYDLRGLGVGHSIRSVHIGRITYAIGI